MVIIIVCSDTTVVENIVLGLNLNSDSCIGLGVQFIAVLLTSYNLRYEVTLVTNICEKWQIN